MYILILTNKPPFPAKDGGAIAVFNLAKGLAETGTQVHILAMNTSKHKGSKLQETTNQNLRLDYVDVKTNIRLFNLTKNLLFSKLPYNAERFINQNFLNELKNILQAKEINIIQLEGPYLSFCIDTIRQYSKAKISFRAHNIEHEIWQRTAAFQKNHLKKSYLNHLAKRIKKFELSLLKQVDLLVPITSRDDSEFKKFGNNLPSAVIPVGIDITNEFVQHYGNFESIFYIGALDWIPNQEGLLWFIEKVWPIILTKVPNVQFHIAGRNAPKWLEKVFAKPRIRFHGEIENASDFIAKNGIMIVPLFSGSGMRVKIIEGMALGKAIITTSIGAEGIEAINGHDIVIANTAWEFVDELIKLFRNQDLISSISSNATEFVRKNYDNKLISQNLLNFYKQHI